MQNDIDHSKTLHETIFHNFKGSFEMLTWSRLVQRVALKAALLLGASPAALPGPAGLLPAPDLPLPASSAWAVTFLDKKD